MGGCWRRSRSNGEEEVLLINHNAEGVAESAEGSEAGMVSKYRRYDQFVFL
jgi:hypothetical protein